MTNPAPDTSVVICAYTEERWGDLIAAVASVQHQSLRPHEIIVVIDHNLRLLERARTHLLNAVVVENSGPHGLSSARNSGIVAARGAFVAFLDDDAVAAPDWLERLRTSCDDPRVLGAGGSSIPYWLTAQPTWFPAEFNWVVGCTYRGLPRTTTVVRNPFGGCSCIRREIFDTAGGYRAEVGRVGKHLISCDETEFCIRVRQHRPDGVFLYEPTATIRHVVPPSRASWRYFCSRCYFEGRSKALVARFVGARDGLASERTYAIQTLPMGVIRGVGDMLTHRDITGLARSGAIVAGLAIVTAGYVTEALAQQLAKWRDSSHRHSSVFNSVNGVPASGRPHISAVQKAKASDVE